MVLGQFPNPNTNANPNTHPNLGVIFLLANYPDRVSDIVNMPMIFKGYKLHS